MKDARSITRALSGVALCLVLIAGTPVGAAAQGTSVQIPRTDLATLQSVRPVGQQFIVRFTWGGALAESKTPGCLSFKVDRSGAVPSADDLPSGVFVQLNEGNAGVVQGLEVGDQVDVIGLVGWASCASTRASDLGWLAMTPSQVIRISKAGDPAPAEPALDFGGATRPASPGPSTSPGGGGTATPAEAETRGYEAVVHLTDGSAIAGRVVEETLSDLVVRVAGQEMRIDKSQVQKIERSSDEAQASRSEPEQDRAEARQEPRPTKPPKTAEEKARDAALGKAVAKTAIGGGLMVPALIFIPTGGVYLGGGIAWETGGATFGLPPNIQNSLRSGTWPVGVAAFWGAGFPMLFTGINLLKQGVDELRGLETPQTAHRRRFPRAVPWLVVEPGRVGVGIVGQF